MKLFKLFQADDQSFILAYFKDFDLEVNNGIPALVYKTQFAIICSESSSIDFEIDQLNPWFYEMNSSMITPNSEDANEVCLKIQILDSKIDFLFNHFKESDWHT